MSRCARCGLLLRYPSARLPVKALQDFLSFLHLDPHRLRPPDPKQPPLALLRLRLLLGKANAPRFRSGLCGRHWALALFSHRLPRPSLILARVLSIETFLFRPARFHRQRRVWDLLPR